MKSDVKGHLVVSIRHYAIFEDPDDNTDQAQDIAAMHIDFLCGKYGPGKRQDLHGPYDFAASCSRLAKRPAMVHTALSKGAKVARVSALADEAANDPVLQKFLTTMSTGAATAAFRLIP